ncbi:MAG: hypothetical protein J6E45_04790 [Prevotella sp.]|nr:hypothetical protein [Prevotella sp.]
MDKKSYIKPESEVINMEDLMEGNGPVKNSGTGYKFNNDPADADDLEGKGVSWDDDDGTGAWNCTLPRWKNKAWDNFDK